MALFGFFGGNKSTDPAPTVKSNEDKPKPCCVCKSEKATRDECMLFSKTDNPIEECQDLIGKYKLCMKGYGFTV